MPARSRGLPWVLALGLLAAPARGQSVRVVISADTRPYREAWEGFREELGDASLAVAGTPGADEAPRAARVVVVFGAKAALQDYRGRAPVIEVMSPSTSFDPAQRGRLVRVGMAPAPEELMSRLKLLQPELKRLAIVWRSSFYGAEYLPLVQEAGARLGVAVESVEMANDEDIPLLLRSLAGRVDALWLPPDPLLISEDNFRSFRLFARANRVPLYAPMSGLVERGATASVGVSFRSIGREAARAARRTLDGRAPARLNFPGPVETTLSLSAAERTGLKIGDAARSAVERTLP